MLRGEAKAPSILSEHGGQFRASVGVTDQLVHQVLMHATRSGNRPAVTALLAAKAVCAKDSSAAHSRCFAVRCALGGLFSRPMCMSGARVAETFRVLKSKTPQDVIMRVLPEVL